VLDLYASDQRLSLTRQFVDGEPMVKVDAVRLRQAMHNLLKNALEAIGDQRKPQILVSTNIVSGGDAAWVDITVADNGPGLPDGFGERWFEPYTSSKSRGTGLGLAVVKKIAEEHGGSVRAEQRSGGGAEFTLRLPLGEGR
jgi:C4-dicarboxylate-specific signal transduction histidine kinase